LAQLGAADYTVDRRRSSTRRLDRSATSTVKMARRLPQIRLKNLRKSAQIRLICVLLSDFDAALVRVNAQGLGVRGWGLQCRTLVLSSPKTLLDFALAMIVVHQDLAG
jgi:hypothetical protein